jgi:hypothetical protein
MFSRRIAVASLLLLLAALPAIAQRITGSITGQVEDPKGALVQGAKITVANEDTGFSLQTTTSDQGTFTVPDLPPAIYKVTITASGFTTWVEKATVRVGLATPVRARLGIGSTTTEVMVSAQSVTVDIQKSTGTRRDYR